MMMAYVIAGLRRNRRSIYIIPCFFDVFFVVEMRTVYILRSIMKVINTNRYCRIGVCISYIKRENRIVLSKPLEGRENTHLHDECRGCI